MKFDHTALTNADPEVVAPLVYGSISAVQDGKAHDRALAIACHLTLITEVLGVNRQDLMTTASNLMASPDGQYRREQFVAARQYLENEE